MMLHALKECVGKREAVKWVRRRKKDEGEERMIV